MRNALRYRLLGGLARAVAVASLAFLLIPLPFIMLSSFSRSSYRLFTAGGPTLEWYVSFFQNPRLMAAFGFSLQISVFTTVLALLLATPTAFAMVRHPSPAGRVLLAAVNTPMIVPGVVTGIAVLSFLQAAGVARGFVPILVTMTCCTIPLCLRPLTAVLFGLERNVERAARNLGATAAQTFWHVTLPQIAPGLFAAGVFTFVEAMDNFSVNVFLTDFKTSTLPVEAYSYIRDFDDPTVAAMATVLIVMSVAIVALLDRIFGLTKVVEFGVGG